jgi:hypothetical protein
MEVALRQFEQAAHAAAGMEAICPSKGTLLAVQPAPVRELEREAVGHRAPREIDEAAVPHPLAGSGQERRRLQVGMVHRQHAHWNRAEAQRIVPVQARAVRDALAQAQRSIQEQAITENLVGLQADLTQCGPRTQCGGQFGRKHPLQSGPRRLRVTRGIGGGMAQQVRAGPVRSVSRWPLVQVEPGKEL